MRQLLVFLMISAMFLGQGFSAGAAMCVHRSADDHAQALSSRDGAIAAVAQEEDDAASLVSKKAASAGAVGLNWAAHLPSPSIVLPPLAAAERITRSLADGPALIGISAIPLLRPPHPAI